ncbi:MarP family serine protease [Agromyces soli]
MGWSLLLDAVLIVIAVLAILNGWRQGLLRTAAGLIGLVAGGVAAWVAMPWVASLVPSPEWRTPAVVATALVLLVAGASAGAWVGRLLRRGADAVKLGVVDRLLGAIGNLLVTAFVVALVASGVQAMGVPGLSPAVSGSNVLRVLDRVTPEPAKELLAEIRTAALGQGVPWLIEVIGGPTVSPPLPDTELGGDSIAAASASVVRITGNAYQCGTTSTGSGFVVAPDRVVTNAHVVAGVDEPVVEAPGLGAVAGRVVAFDPDADLALIATDPLDVAPLALAEPPAAGTAVAIAGYPFGGPLDVHTGSVLSTGPLTIVEGGRTSTREVTTLAARVDHGNSGGPVLTGDGRVAAVVFAKSEDVADVGFAVPVDVLAPLVASAAGLGTPVGTGSCTATR